MFVFSPTSASETPKAMEQLSLPIWMPEAMRISISFFLIPCVILDFLCIHPFRDGNGRMSRLLSLLLLYKNGFDAGKYVSFEEQINNYKAYYYEALRQSSVGWETNENSYFPLSRISSPHSICAIRNCTSGLQWYTARKLRRRPVWRQQS